MNEGKLIGFCKKHSWAEFVIEGRGLNSCPNCGCRAYYRTTTYICRACREEYLSGRKELCSAIHVECNSCGLGKGKAVRERGLKF